MALKALSKDEDLAAVPGDQPVLVQLPEFQEVADDKPETKKPVLKVVEPDEENPAVKILTEQLEAMKAANAESEKRARESDRRAEQAERERQSALADKADTESDAVQSGLSAAQSEQTSAKAALKTAGEAGDWEAIAEAQARIARAATDIREFERASATLADNKERATKQPQQIERQDRPTDINSVIDSNPQLLATERVWLKAHPEAIMDTTRNKELDVAYIKATRKGLSRGSPDYFKFIEAEMGYASAPVEDEGMSVSAPVSRNERGNDGKPTGGKIMLTPEERDMAKSMGVTDIEYARQKVALESARKGDPEKYR